MPVIDDIIALLNLLLGLIIHGWEYILWILGAGVVIFLVCCLLP